MRKDKASYEYNLHMKTDTSFVSSKVSTKPYLVQDNHFDTAIRKECSVPY